jgi:hypothetical protein
VCQGFLFLMVRQMMLWGGVLRVSLSTHACAVLSGLVVAGSGSVAGAVVGAGAQRPRGKGMAQGEPVFGLVPAQEAGQISCRERVARTYGFDYLDPVGRNPVDAFGPVLFPDVFDCFGC